MIEPAPPSHPAGLCLLFDLDGTLVDAFDAVAESLNAVRRDLGYDPVLPVHIRRLVGRGEEWLLAFFFKREDRRRARELYRRHHESVLIRYCRPLFFAGEILQRAQRRGWPCGVVSNRPQEQLSAVVQAFGWGDRLAAVIGARDGRPLKPDPSMIHQAIGRMKAAPEAAVLIGDTDIDAAAAAAAGIPFVGVATGASNHAALKAAGAVKVFKDLRSCWEWLAKQTHGAKGFVHA